MRGGAAATSTSKKKPLCAESLRVMHATTRPTSVRYLYRLAAPDPGIDLGFHDRCLDKTPTQSILLMGCPNARAGVQIVEKKKKDLRANCDLPSLITTSCVALVVPILGWMQLYLTGIGRERYKNEAASTAASSCPPYRCGL